MLEKLIRDVKENSFTHGSLPFWSWNDRLEKDELIKQIHNMKEVGMNGFFMHARFGLETEYLSDEWFEAITACIAEAKKLGLEAWSYDENGWPSGFGGGELLKDPDNFQSYIEYAERDAFPEDALAVYCEKDGEWVRIKDASEAHGKLKCIWHRRNSSYTDILDERVVKKFIDSTYEVYKKRLGGEVFGKTMPGFFTDEPQYYRSGTPWSSVFAEKFQKRFGYDILDKLWLVFEDGEGYKKLRYDYHYLLHELYISSFIKQIYEWCENNGCQVTGHSMGEDHLSSQINCTGGVMPFYRYEHIPGIDWLCRPIKRDISSKQLGSVCAQLGKKKALSEMFAMCGWDVTPEELKNIADMQYVNGVNLTCQHLYAYSYRGQRKRDYPAHYCAHNPWQKYLKDFNLFFDRVGYALSLGTELADTLVIHPVHNSYMYYTHPDRNEAMTREDHKHYDLSDALGTHQVAYHYADETMLRDLGRVEGDKIRLGECVYSKVVMPDVESIDASTAAMMKEYLAGGGKLVLFGGAPDLVDAVPADLSFIKENMTLDELFASQNVSAGADGENCPTLRIMTRVVDGARLIYITNVSKDPVSGVKLRVKDCKNLVRIDPGDLGVSAVAGRRLLDGDFEADFDFAGSESFLLAEDPSVPAIGKAAKKPDSFRPPKTKMPLVSLSANALTLDRVSFSKNGTDFDGPTDIMELKNRLYEERYFGRLWLRYSFDVKEIPESLSVCLEPMRNGEVSVNGVKIETKAGGFLDPRFLTADILPLVHTGENHVTQSFDYFQRDYVYYVLYGGVSESLRNCLNFDTEIESAYLFGNFGVETPGEKTEGERLGWSYKGDFRIVGAPGSVDPENLQFSLLPFFAGSVTFAFGHTYKPGDPSAIKLTGRYAVAEVKVNGKYAGKLMFTHTLDLDGLLKEGENEIEITLTNSNRNLLGPHHHARVEHWDVGPRTFTREGLWKNGEASEYVKDRYGFVRFGIDCGEA
ncbi:MAG: hypothetical protein IJV00_04650 [Clostridia bacterium]|nr:hypothetical protein [Clostridia bacterium]